MPSICDISVNDAHYSHVFHIPVPKYFIILSFLLMLPLSHLYPQTIRKVCTAGWTNMNWNKIGSQTNISETLYQSIVAIFLKQWHTKVSLHRMSSAAVSLVEQVTHVWVSTVSQDKRGGTLKFLATLLFLLFFKQRGGSAVMGVFLSDDKHRKTEGPVLTYGHWDTTKLCYQHFANVHMLEECQVVHEMVNNWQHGFAKNRSCQTSAISSNDSVNSFVVKG